MPDLNRSFDKLMMTKSLLTCVKIVDTTLSFRAKPRNLFKLIRNAIHFSRQSQSSLTRPLEPGFLP